MGFTAREIDCKLNLVTEERESEIAREIGEFEMREWNFDRGKDGERGREDARARNCEKSWVNKRKLERERRKSKGEESTEEGLPKIGK